MLRHVCRLALLMGALAGAQTPAQEVAPPPDEGIVYVVSFLDIAADAADAAQRALRTFADAGRRAQGNLELRVFREIGQPNRFMITEAWAEQSDYAAHSQSSAQTRLQEELAEFLLSPNDVRVHRAFGIGAPQAGAAADPPAAAIYVQTHLDVAPPFFTALSALLQPFVDASRSEHGAMSFDILQHIAPRQNHLTLLEAWRSEADLNAHRSSAHARTFRSEILPILGSLYDERLYRLVDP